MGGKAFGRAAARGEPILQTPRMPQDVYIRLRDQYKSILAKAFDSDKVECLIEAPGKTDYGDIDFVVPYRPEDVVNIQTFSNVANAIGAVAVLIQSTTFCQFAVRVDGAKSERAAVKYHNLLDSQNHAPGTPISDLCLAQIDVELIPLESFDWFRFCNSYGDTLGILGHLTRPLGLSMRHGGLFLRLQELDETKVIPRLNIAEADGLVFLTQDPDLVMTFLHLDQRRYHQGFDTLDEFYSWLSECRLITSQAFRIQCDTSGLRRRVATRTVFHGFFHEWLPAHMPLLFGVPENGESTTSNNDDETLKLEIHHLRDILSSEATAFFGKTTEAEHMRADMQRRIANAKAEQLLLPIVARHSNTADKSLTEIMRALRRYTNVSEKGQPRLMSESLHDRGSQLHALLDEEGNSLLDEEYVDRWIQDNWHTVKILNRACLKNARAGQCS